MSAGGFLPITEPWAQMHLPPCLPGKHPLPAGLGSGERGDSPRQSPWGLTSSRALANPLLWEAPGPRVEIRAQCPRGRPGPKDLTDFPDFPLPRRPSPVASRRVPHAANKLMSSAGPGPEAGEPGQTLFRGGRGDETPRTASRDPRLRRGLGGEQARGVSCRPLAAGGRPPLPVTARTHTLLTRVSVYVQRPPGFPKAGSSFRKSQTQNGKMRRTNPPPARGQDL